MLAGASREPETRGPTGRAQAYEPGPAARVRRTTRAIRARARRARSEGDQLDAVPRGHGALEPDGSGEADAGCDQLDAVRRGHRGHPDVPGTGGAVELSGRHNYAGLGR
jgi:hypothetical protein